jgi:hypothetical protein
MSQSNKKGYAALYDLQERKKQAKVDHPPVTTSHHQSPPLPTSHHHSPPVTTTPHEFRSTPEESRPSPAPAKDFNRRANSLERDAMPQGIFPGSSKKIYDALYLRSRGAHPPRTRVRASRRDFLDWTDIRNLKTVDGHLRYLMSVGLIVRDWQLGSTEGPEYEVILPEELPRLPTTPHQSPRDTTTHLLGSGYTQFSGSGGYSQVADLQAISGDDKTLLKTNTESRDDDDAFAVFESALKKAVREITGRDSTPAEAGKWGELADVLVTELKIAAGRTTVSSVPAFLAEHLRRRLWKKEKRQIEAEAAEQKATPASKMDAAQCPDCFGTGMWYPEGFEKGVAKCQHKRLVKIPKAK